MVGFSVTCVLVFTFGVFLERHRTLSNGHPVITLYAKYLLLFNFFFHVINVCKLFAFEFEILFGIFTQSYVYFTKIVLTMSL